MHPFNTLSLPLEKSNLIEASAGTGKTFTIAALYLRLVVERGLMPEQILVVTFTDAATKELRDRIRTRLSDARDQLSGRQCAEDTFITALSDPLLNRDWPGVESALGRIGQALQFFDSAAIATIHGFCHRMLQENAFESGSLYDTELITDQKPLVKQIVEDFWRRSFFSADSKLLPLALNNKWTLAGLSAFLRNTLGKHDLVTVVPRFTQDEVQRTAVLCDDLFSKLSRLWQTARDEIVTLVTEHDGLSRAEKTFRKDLLPGLFERIDVFVAAGNPYALPPDFNKLTNSFIADNTLKKKISPQHQFFDLCQCLKEGVAQRTIMLKWELLVYAGQRLAARKQELNIRFYDDLLIDLYVALDSSQGVALAERIRKRIKAALIDEFQDTDQIQYRIFKKVFQDGDVPLFLIGDPKQAIYSFRGADIFAYLESKRDVPFERHFTMVHNWRSTPQLVAAVNQIFLLQKQHPFVFDELDYPEVVAARDLTPALFAGRDAAPLQFWYFSVDGDDSKGRISYDKAVSRISRAVAEEITALLNDAGQGKAVLDGRALEPADIAVVVRSHREAAAVQAELAARRVPAVLQSNQSVFASPEAHAFSLLLAGIAAPRHEAAIRTALVTPLLGWSANDVCDIPEDGDTTAWDTRCEQFREYHEIWQERGFMAMFVSLLERERIRERLLAQVNGERSITNLLQCGEIIHAKAAQTQLGMDALSAWFSELVALPPDAEEFQIRLESDEQAVRILTIHVSKGLEYPVVFCPFSWGGLFDHGETVTCHDGFTLVSDFGSDEFASHAATARLEALAENLRLLYVALTRAKYRCYLTFGSFKNIESSALSYLLHRAAEVTPENLLAQLQQTVNSMTEAEQLARINAVVHDSSGGIQLVVDPDEALSPYQRDTTLDTSVLCPLRSARTHTSAWRITSFSALSSAHRDVAEVPDHDETAVVVPETAVVSAPSDSIFSFPRGAAAGTFMHSVFEKIDFASRDDRHIDDTVTKVMEQSLFTASSLPAITSMVKHVVSVPLPGLGGCSLTDLSAGDWLTEMEFFFPLKFIESKQLARVLLRYGADGPIDPAAIVARLDFRAVQGMLRGFMDLVFRMQGKYYILDWKSNHLGNRIEDYGKERVAREMERNLYPLQYLLYTIALNRYLELRCRDYCYETGFGGVYYLFLRGIDPAHPESGVFHDLPEPALVRSLTDLLIDCEAN